MIIELSVDEMKRLIGATIRTISTDETRRALNCLCLEASGIALTALSTDGHRLARYALSPLEVPTTESGAVLIPLSIVKDLQRAIKKEKVGTVTIDTGKIGAETVAIEVRPAGVSFRFPKRADDVQFPPWRQILPKHDQDRAGVRWVGVNAYYLADAQEAFNDATAGRHSLGCVQVEFGGELDPMVVSSDTCRNLTIIVMPARVKPDYPAVRPEPEPADVANLDLARAMRNGAKSDRLGTVQPRR